MRILNSQSRQKEEFTPLRGKQVHMYHCGPTVYDSLHIGHVRAALTPDIVRRYLEYKGYHVRYVTNFTDVDDKIIRRAIDESRDCRELTTYYIEEAHQLLMSFNIRPADVHPRATDHITEMIEIVERLLKNGNAYVAKDGDVYFDTASFVRYGALSGRKLEEEEAGRSDRIDEARLAVKKNQGDFVLWKLIKNDKPEIARGGDLVPRWRSPWGDGRPGWHLECSAMSHKYLGVPFDIHTGGHDLLFPHHEDEKAQTECAFHETLGDANSVRYWVHNEFVNMKARPEDANVRADLKDAAGGVKMSKSLGNVKWARDMIWPHGPYDPMAVRMMLLSSHYRSPILFEPALLDESTARLERIYNTLESIERAKEAANGSGSLDTAAALKNFESAMDDDFNTASALGAVFDLCSSVNQGVAAKSLSAQALSDAASTMKTMLHVLGIRAFRAKSGGAGDAAKLIDLLMATRLDARAAKQYTLGDKIRDGLKGLGYEVEDLPGGKWAVKKK
ncbi:MAG TPA: cysteine--tRNA ligase [Planctomycetota bacterium]|nr:cysteine--tRNA ligase [Planctomycetota bacterium]